MVYVDHDEAFLRLTETSLSEIDPGLRIEQTTDPTSVLDLITDEEVKCVVSDHQMPRLTGIELLKHVHSSHLDLRFILFTGQGSEEVASEAISAEVTNYVSKGESSNCSRTVSAGRSSNGASSRRWPRPAKGT